MQASDPNQGVPTPQHPAWHAWAALLTALLLLACLAGFAIVFVLDVRETVLSAAARSLPDRGWLVWANYAIGAVVLGIVTAVMTIDRLRKPAEYAYTADRIAAGQQFVLYLRPFAIERRLIGYLPMIGGVPYIWAIPQFRYLFGLETYLKQAIEPAGLDLIAIGEMDETVGIAKLKPTEAEWQATFVDLAGRATAIVVVPFTSAGSLWELDWIAKNALAKTVLVLPSVKQDPFIGAVKSHGLPQQWQALRLRFADLVDLPDYPLQGQLLTFRPTLRLAGEIRWHPDLALEFGHANFGEALGDLLRTRGPAASPKPQSA